MKHPLFGLLRIKSLKDRYLSLLIASALLLFSFIAKGQSYTTVNGRFNYSDSIKFAKLKNNASKDSVLTTDSEGRIIFKYINPASLSNDRIDEFITGSDSRTITLQFMPIPNTIVLYKNGVRLPYLRFYISGAVIMLLDPRQTSDIFQADYKF